MFRCLPLKNSLPRNHCLRIQCSVSSYQARKDKHISSMSQILFFLSSKEEGSVALSGWQLSLVWTTANRDFNHLPSLQSSSNPLIPVAVRIVSAICLQSLTHFFTQLFHAKFQLFIPCRSPFLQFSQNFLISFTIPLTLGVRKNSLSLVVSIAHRNINEVVIILRAPSWSTARILFLPLFTKRLSTLLPPPHHHRQRISRSKLKLLDTFCSPWNLKLNINFLDRNACRKKRIFHIPQTQHLWIKKKHVLALCKIQWNVHEKFTLPVLL